MRRPGKAVVLLATAVCVGLLTTAPLASAAEGDLETAFDGDGKLVSDFGGSSALIYGSVVQPDGKLVVVGQHNSDGVIARINPSGAFDSSFGGGDGITVVDSGTTSSSEHLDGVALQPDGKIIAVGTAGLASSSVFVLARVDQSGTPDAAFVGPAGNTDSIDGVFRIAQGTFDQGVAIAANGDKIDFGGNADADGVVYQLNQSDGSLDNEFNGGHRNFTFGGSILFGGLTVQPDGKVIVGGKPNTGLSGFAVARLTTTGNLDTTTFHSPDGYVVSTVPPGYFSGSVGGAGGVTMDGSNIVVAGSVQASSSPFPEDPALARFTSAGQVDTGFGSNGYAILSLPGPLDGASGVVRQPNGKLLIGGVTGDANTFQALIARFTTAGVPDSTFHSPDAYNAVSFATAPPRSTVNTVALSDTGVAYVAGGYGNVAPPDDFGVAAFRAFTPVQPPVATPAPPGTNPVPAGPTGLRAKALKKCAKIKNKAKKRKCKKRARQLPV